MEELLKEAKELEPELIENRRHIHANPECGYELEKTTRFVMDKLTSYGYEPELICKGGVVATVGDPAKGRTILLRADMDALPMREESGLPFAAAGEMAHTCGHDTHTAMLLGAAKILKRREAELAGCVKLMFQPDEEATSPDGVGGCETMIAAGLLENPKVDAAFSLHIYPVDLPTGVLAYRLGTLMCSYDKFVIRIQGRGGHGSQPYNAASPINIAAHIYFGLQEFIARELPAHEEGVVTVGTIHSGTAANIIPDTAELTGTIRMSEEASRTRAKARIRELSTAIAKAYGGDCTVEYMHGAPTVYNDPALTQKIAAYQTQLGGECLLMDHPFSGGDDLSVLSQAVPTCYMMLGGGTAEEGFAYPVHSPHMVVNEDALHKGVAFYVNAAIRWLQDP